MSEFQLAQTAWSRTLLRSLANAGVQHFVVSPGSRSTPLVAALQALGLSFDLVVDERSAGFFALGRSKLTGVPSALVCTSGSAPAHYYPAVIEADESQTPLLILSADRPAELQGNRSAQTIDQRHLYGRKVRWFDELGTPEGSPGALAALERKAAQAVARAQFPFPGPVHLNVPLRKPLEPAGAAPTPDAPAARSAPRHFSPVLEPSASGLSALAERAANARRPLLIAGPFAPCNAPSWERVRAFATKTGWPVLLETASNLRLGFDPSGDVLVVDAFDGVFRALLRAETEVRARFQPDFVLALGDLPTSSSWLELSRGATKASLGPLAAPDPENDFELFVPGEVDRSLARLESMLPPPDPAFAQRLRRANGLAWEHVDALSTPRAADPSQAPGNERFEHEGQCTRVLAEALEPDDLLCVGNSLPIRLLDTFVPSSARRVRVLSQRGANGIDGLIAGATGAATQRRSPSFLLLGDISFLHDVGSLTLLAQLAPHLVVVVFNNRGGRLFEQLPIARAAHGAALTPWLTPHAFDLSFISAAFGIPSSRVGHAAEFALELTRARQGAGPRVIEAMIEPSGTSAVYRELELRLAADLAALG